MKNNDVDALIKELQQTTRDDGGEAYAVYQLALGMRYQEEKHDYDQAITHYNNVTKKDNPQTYATAQLALGHIYQYVKQDYDQAITHYNNVIRDDNPQAYASAQSSLGNIYQEEKHDYDQAITHYKNATKENDPQTYAWTQLALGYIYQDVKQDYNLAEAYYKKVTKNDNQEAYAKTQFYPDHFYQDRKQDCDQAETYFKNAIKRNNLKAYAYAQLKLGEISKLKQDYDQAITHYNNVTRKDNPKTYASAQHNLGNIYKEVKQDYNQAEIHYIKITKNDNPHAYSQAQYQLAHIYFFEENDNDTARKYYNNVEYFSSESYLYISARVILELMDVDSDLIKDKQNFNGTILTNIDDICKSVNDIKNKLLVSFGINDSTKGIKPERRVAHYTRPEVLFKLLKGNSPSKFRLNIADLMNDPSENRILTDWLKLSNNSDDEVKTFLASFSFNYNSLNQFRLYGNEDNIVGSGVSIAFDQNFFNRNPEHFINDEIGSIMSTKALSSGGIKQSKSMSKQTKNVKNNTPHPLPLYRCLYFEPKTKYMTLAKRSKQLFYQEMYDEKKNTEAIDAEWKAYTEAINEKETIKNIREQLEKIKESIAALLKEEELRKIPSLKKLLSLAVLPITCLIKHAAFEDEDECRIVYITHSDDKNIKEPQDYQSADNLYVEYTNVENYIDRIYLGPQCKLQKQSWLQRHLKKRQGKEIKLIASELPLR